jgi:hypothetical protein
MMGNINYKKISGILKILSKIVGIFCIIYGCVVGILGLGPDGPFGLNRWRIVGLFVLLQGILYFQSNSKFMRNPFLIGVYLATTFSPGMIVLAASLVSIYSVGFNDFLEAGGVTTAAVLFFISVFAPLSMVFSILERKGKSSTMNKS